MTWNHRVIRYEDGSLEIVEVYYEDDGSLMGYSDATVYARADDEGGAPDSLQRQVAWFLDSLDRPILDVGDFFAHTKGATTQD